MSRHRVSALARGLRAAALAGAVLLMPAVTARASSGGIFGFSGKTAGQTCNVCHSGGVAPLVRFEGPTQVDAGSTSTYTFVVTSQSALQGFAGLDVAASTGTLAAVANQGDQVLVGEVTHKAPMRVDNKGEASWKFTWQAPPVGGIFTLYGAGNSVNDNTIESGDLSAATTLLVAVIGSVTATPTSTPSITPTRKPTSTRSPTATAVGQLSPTPTSSPSPTATPTQTTTPSATPLNVTVECPGDCDADARIAPDEILALIAVLNGVAASTCDAADANGDHQVSAADLGRLVFDVVNYAPSGCPQ